MACCNGTDQIKEFNINLYWRAIPEIERKLSFKATGVDGKWNGEGSGSYEMGDEIKSCDRTEISGTQVLRVKLELKCTQTTTKTYIDGIMYITFAKSSFKARLKPKLLFCGNITPDLAVEWNVLFLGPLGMSRVTVSRQPPE